MHSSLKQNYQFCTKALPSITLLLSSLTKSVSLYKSHIITIGQSNGNNRAIRFDCNDATANIREYECLYYISAFFNKYNTLAESTNYEITDVYTAAGRVSGMTNIVQSYINMLNTTVKGTNAQIKAIYDKYIQSASKQAEIIWTLIETFTNPKLEGGDFLEMRIAQEAYKASQMVINEAKEYYTNTISNIKKNNNLILNQTTLEEQKYLVIQMFKTMSGFSEKRINSIGVALSDVVNKLSHFKSEIAAYLKNSSNWHSDVQKELDRKAKKILLSVKNFKETLLPKVNNSEVINAKKFFKALVTLKEYYEKWFTADIRGPFFYHSNAPDNESDSVKNATYQTTINFYQLMIKALQQKYFPATTIPPASKIHYDNYTKGQEVGKYWTDLNCIKSGCPECT